MKLWTNICDIVKYYAKDYNEQRNNGVSLWNKLKWLLLTVVKVKVNK